MNRPRVSPPPESAADRTALADRLAQLRRRAGLTQVQVSQRVGKPQSWIGKLETGRRSLLFAEAILLAKLYGVPLSALDPNEEPPER